MGGGGRGGERERGTQAHIHTALTHTHTRVFTHYCSSVVGYSEGIGRRAGGLQVCRGVHRVTYLEKNPVRIFKDEAPTPLPQFGLMI